MQLLSKWMIFKMLYIIAFLFINVNGDEYLNVIEEPYFKTEKECNIFVNKNYVQRKDLKFSCVREDLVKKSFQ